MRRLEIIHLRSSAEPVERLAQRIAASLAPASDDASLVTIYRRPGVDTDLAIHVRPDPGSVGAAGASGLALRLAAALRAYGLVEHTLWEESR